MAIFYLTLMAHHDLPTIHINLKRSCNLLVHGGLHDPCKIHKEWVVGSPACFAILFVLHRSHLHSRLLLVCSPIPYINCLMGFFSFLFPPVHELWCHRRTTTSLWCGCSGISSWPGPHRLPLHAVTWAGDPLHELVGVRYLYGQDGSYFGAVQSPPLWLFWGVRTHQAGLYYSARGFPLSDWEYCPRYCSLIWSKASWRAPGLIIFYTTVMWVMIGMGILPKLDNWFDQRRINGHIHKDLKPSDDGQQYCRGSLTQPGAHRPHLGVGFMPDGVLYDLTDAGS